MQTTEHINLLGMEAEDLVTGFKGIVATISFDLYGCVQVILTPKVNEKGEAIDSRWFDVTRIKVTGEKPVMELPDFEEGYVADGRKGPAEKSIP